MKPGNQNLVAALTRNEPRRPHAKFLEQLEQTRRSDLAGKHASGNVARRVFAAIAAEPV